MGHRTSVLACVAVMLVSGCADITDGDVAGAQRPAATETPEEDASVDPEPSPGASVDPPPADLGNADIPPLGLDVLATGLAQPTAVATAPGDDRIFVAERGGVVQALLPDGTLQRYLDISDVVEWEESLEQGLLGIAMHPDFSANGRFFVYHALASNDTVLKEFRAADGDASRADRASERVVLTIDKGPDKRRHNGGKLSFGPGGNLWMSVGDGVERREHPQDPSTLLGSILRIDVDGGEPYGVPADNAFPDGVGGAPEVWAYGLRNPWQFSLDPVGGHIWIGDVGNQLQEEIDVWPIGESGANFGWPVFEGTADGPIPEVGDGSDYVEPVLTIERGSDDACSIVAGPVYRGDAVPGLRGRFLYSDWCVGWLRSLELDGDGVATDIVDHSEGLGLGRPSSFGVDNDGEILIADFRKGLVARIVAADGES